MWGLGWRGNVSLKTVYTRSLTQIESFLRKIQMYLMHSCGSKSKICYFLVELCSFLYFQSQQTLMKRITTVRFIWEFLSWLYLKSLSLCKWNCKNLIYTWKVDVIEDKKTTEFCKKKADLWFNITWVHEIYLYFSRRILIL